jgi:hypothetical protein
MPKSYELIASATVGSGGAADITFSSIPATFTDLNLVVSARGTFAANLIGLYLKVNTSTANLSGRYLRGFNTGVDSGSVAGFLMDMSAASSTSSTFGSYSVYFPNYANGSNKSFSVDSAAENNSTASFGADLGFNSGLWSNTAAITGLTVYPDQGNFTQYSTAYLYGIESS